MSRILAIASGKGGVGKTWLTIGLAQVLGSAGLRILVVDGDLGLANIDIQLGLAPGPDLVHVLAGRASLAAAVRPLPAVGFDLLAGRSGSALLAGRSDLALGDLLRDLGLLAARYDLLLLDLAAGADQTVRQLLRFATEQLIVTVDEPTALTDAYALIKLCQRDALPMRLPPRLVVNQVLDHQSGERTYQGLMRICARFLGQTPGLGGLIRRDPHVPDSIRRQLPLLSCHPQTPAAEDLRRIARTLTTAAGSA